MLCAPVFIFTSGSSTLLGCPCCGLSIWLSLLVIFNTLFWVYANYFHKKTDKTRKYSKSAIFVLSENGCRQLPVTQASKALTLRASLRFCCRYCVPRMCCSKYSTFCETRYLANFRWASVSTTAATLTYHEFTNEKLQSTIAHNNVQHRKLHHYKICIMPNMTHNQHSLVIYMLLCKGQFTWCNFDTCNLLTQKKLKDCWSRHVELVPAVLQSFTSSPSKANTSLRRTVGEPGPEFVRLRGSCLYSLLTFQNVIFFNLSIRS